MIENYKPDNPRTGTLMFILLWTATNVGGWMLGLWLWLTFPFFREHVAHSLMVTLVPGAISALGQFLLMQYTLKKRALIDWLPVTIAGALAASIAYNWYMPDHLGNEFLTMRLMMLFVPVTLAQTLWLSRRVKAAGVWAITGLMAALAFGLPLQNLFPTTDQMQYAAYGAAAALQGVMTGAVMRFLWLTDREERSNRNTLAIGDSVEEEAERIERLREKMREDERPAARSKSIAKQIRP